MADDLLKGGCEDLASEYHHEFKRKETTPIEIPIIESTSYEPPAPAPYEAPPAPIEVAPPAPVEEY